MNERTVLAILSITIFVGIGVIGVSRNEDVAVSKQVVQGRAEGKDYKLSSSGTTKVILDRPHELSEYRATADLVLFFRRCDASSIPLERQKIVIGKFENMLEASLREEALTTEKKLIEALPARENPPGGWVSFCKIMAEDVARGLYNNIL
jgi:hypothetical protein